MNAPAATGMAVAAYAVSPRIDFDTRYEPYLSSGHPDSVTPGLSYQATCWKHGQYVTSVTGQGGSDIWVRLYGNHGHLWYGPVVHFLAWPGSVTAGVATKCP